MSTNRLNDEIEIEAQKEKDKKSRLFFRNVVEVYKTEEDFIIYMDVFCTAIKSNLDKFDTKTQAKLIEFLKPYDKLSNPHKDPLYKAIQGYYNDMIEYEKLEKLLNNKDLNSDKKKLLADKMQQIADEKQDQFDTKFLTFMLMKEGEKLKFFKEIGEKHKEFSEYLEELKRKNPDAFESINRDLIYFDKTARGEKNVKLNEIDASSGKSIKDFIIMPIQRTPRYDLLVKTMVENANEKNIQPLKIFHQTVKREVKKVDLAIYSKEISEILINGDKKNYTSKKIATQITDKIRELDKEIKRSEKQEEKKRAKKDKSQPKDKSLRIALNDAYLQAIGEYKFKNKKNETQIKKIEKINKFVEKNKKFKKSFTIEAPAYPPPPSYKPFAKASPAVKSEFLQNHAAALLSPLGAHRVKKSEKTENTDKNKAENKKSYVPK